MLCHGCICMQDNPLKSNDVFSGLKGNSVCLTAVAAIVQYPHKHAAEEADRVCQVAVVHSLPCCLDRVPARDTPAGHMMWAAHIGDCCRLYTLCTCSIIDM